MNKPSLSSILKPKTESVVWRPLLPNVRCMQVPLTEVASVLDLYTFDIISLGGGKLGGGYKILPEDCTHKGRVREGDVKAITLVNESTKQCSRSQNAYTEFIGCSTRVSKIYPLWLIDKKLTWILLNRMVVTRISATGRAAS